MKKNDLNPTECYLSKDLCGVALSKWETTTFLLNGFGRFLSIAVFRLFNCLRNSIELIKRLTERQHLINTDPFSIPPDTKHNLILY